MAAEALHSCLKNLSVLYSGRMTDAAVQYPWDMFIVRKRDPIDLDRLIFESLVTLAALRMGNLRCLGERNGPFGVAF